jgi:hypothetical protein
MKFRIFAQRPPGAIPVLELASAAERVGRKVLRVGKAADPLVLELGSASAELVARATLETDREDARAAEAVSGAAGMGGLAARCESVWELVTSGATPEEYALVAVLCAVALGPALPEDGSTLLGVKSALARANAA